MGSSPSRFSLLIIKEEFPQRRLQADYPEVTESSGRDCVIRDSRLIASQTVFWSKGRADKNLATWLWRAARHALNICYFSLILFSGWVGTYFTLPLLSNFSAFLSNICFLKTFFSPFSYRLLTAEQLHISHICAAPDCKPLLRGQTRTVSRPVVLIMLMFLWEESSINRGGTALKVLAKQELKCSHPSSPLIFCMAEPLCKVAERRERSTSDWVGFRLNTGIMLLFLPPSCLTLHPSFHWISSCLC